MGERLVTRAVRLSERTVLALLLFVGSAVAGEPPACPPGEAWLGGNGFEKTGLVYSGGGWVEHACRTHEAYRLALDRAWCESGSGWGMSFSHQDGTMWTQRRSEWDADTLTCQRWTDYHLYVGHWPDGHTILLSQDEYEAMAPDGWYPSPCGDYESGWEISCSTLGTRFEFVDGAWQRTPWPDATK